MHDGAPHVPTPDNEPVFGYGPGSPEKAALKAELARQTSTEVEIPLIIGGKQVRTGNTATCVMPHDHRHVLARYHLAGPEQVAQAIAAALDAKPAWEAMRWEDRAAVMLRAAELLAGKYRAVINAATMLNQSKTAHQAEIDAACELIDFWRFNPKFAAELYAKQPHSVPGMWNQSELRALEGYVFAAAPFNFTSIAINLATAPALMGNVTLWKPAHDAMLAPYYLMQLLEEAGLPPGVVNLLPGLGADVGDPALDDPRLAGVHFTGSTATFRSMWKRVAGNLERYRTYPRLVGETGGKDFIVAHASANPDALVTAIVRGGFEYQGQKCSAVSRVYVPDALWARIEPSLLEQTASLRMGDPTDFRNFMGAVINKRALDKHAAAIAEAQASSEARVIVGGEHDASRGYFVRPTVIRTENPRFRTMVDELFGPIVTVYVYPEARWEQTLALVDQSSPYGLTGAVFADDRRAVVQASQALRHAAGNFYINDKPTGAVVGQQPFGGARASGTNDKAGSYMNLLRWTSARSIKETFCPPTSVAYPFMDEA